LRHWRFVTRIGFFLGGAYRPTPDISRHEIVVVKQTFDWLHTGRELIRLHRTGEIDDATMRELEHEELSAISAKA